MPTLTLTDLTTVDAQLVSHAREAIGSLAPDLAAHAISDWVCSNVEYQPGTTGVRTSAQEAWLLRAGVCQDISHLTIMWCGEWFGFDPTNGVPAGPRHVIVARGRDYSDVTPLKGVYHGRASTTAPPPPASASPSKSPA